MDDTGFRRRYGTEWILLDEKEGEVVYALRSDTKGLDEYAGQHVRLAGSWWRVSPWESSDPFFQEPPEEAALDVDRFFRDVDLEELTRRTYDALDLDVRGVLARSDLYGRQGKNQHAFCLSVGREYPYDVRVLANVRPDAYWMNTMLHEFGHAVYDRHINPKLPYFLRTVAHTCTTEALALMMGSLAEEPGWLKKVAGVSDNELAGERLAARRRADGLVFTRWALVVFNFEKALYENPDREDLNSMWWDLVERLQLVDRSPGRDEPDWAAKIHLAIAPVYYHNYVLGHLISAQLRNHLESHVTRGPFYEHEVAGRYLMESFLGPGAPRTGATPCSGRREKTSTRTTSWDPSVSRDTRR